MLEDPLLGCIYSALLMQPPSSDLRFLRDGAWDVPTDYSLLVEEGGIMVELEVAELHLYSDLSSCRAHTLNLLSVQVFASILLSLLGCSFAPLLTVDSAHSSNCRSVMLNGLKWGKTLQSCLYMISPLCDLIPGYALIFLPSSFLLPHTVPATLASL